MVDVSKLFNQALVNIYKKRGGKQPLVESHLFDISNKVLQHGIGKTFKAAGAEFGKQNKDFVSQFQSNTRVFSAFKNHQQTKDIVKCLTKSDGSLRSFSEFKKEALQISQDYNKTWLQTEYNTAVRSARMAANWKQFERTKHLYPNLEYMPSRSAHPRDSHRDLWGTIKPIDDPFWNDHLPPSDWNCKCSVRATKSDVVDPPDDAMNIVPPCFRNNPGKTASFVKVEETPYYKHTDPYIRKELNDKSDIITTKENEIRMNKSHETGVAFNEQGDIILEKRGKKYSVSFTTEEMKLFKDTIFTHNHPRGWGYPETSMQRIGSSFSVNDILLAISANVKEMRAVTPNFTFIMKRPEGGWPSYHIAKVTYSRILHDVKKELFERVASKTTTINKLNTVFYHETNKRFFKKMGIEYLKEKTR